MSSTERPQDVMRIRRDQPSRLEGFVDASFAFAVTLLVISIGHVPDSVEEMLQALRGAPTFAVCFALIARIWYSHRNWSRRYDLEDTTSVLLSLLLVFIVLVYVYPLRLLFSLLFAGMSDGLLMEQTVRLTTVRELRIAYAVFSLGHALIWLIFAWLNRHAYRLRAAIGLDAAEIVATRYFVWLNFGFGVVGIFSIVIALTAPFIERPWTTSAPGMIYLTLFPLRYFLGRRAMAGIAAAKARTA